MMTNSEKGMIRELRIKGLSYSEVAETTGLNLETIKSYCRRSGLGGKGKDIAKNHDATCKYIICKNCSAQVKQSPKRMKKLFCCDACRTHWWNTHTYMVERKAYYTFTCLHCGKEFQAYGNSKRKYCCHECYIKHRFG